MNFLSASGTDIGIRRKLNEDSFLDRSDIGVWAVADGMGGHEAGDVASARIVEALANLEAPAPVADSARRVEKALQDVNTELLLMAGGGIPPRTIGSTVVVLLVGQQEYRCLWVGDSRAYLVRRRAIEQLTTDHSLVHELVETGLLAAADAASHPDANVITRAVGATAKLTVDSVGGQALPGDHFVLVTDGVTRKVDDDELLDLVVTQNPQQAIRSITQLVLERGAPDNLTSIIVRVL